MTVFVFVREKPLVLFGVVDRFVTAVAQRVNVLPFPAPAPTVLDLLRWNVAEEDMVLVIFEEFVRVSPCCCRWAVTEMPAFDDGVRASFVPGMTVKEAVLSNVDLDR
ncbi:hypothetical protein AGDE_12531 [Angomonas deanei]|uniref:Uncharacterized protein n=1 Tax=Angomonas deanei TaxID=59799 RepID=A0A7G2CB64_9TRYP|nr:hypothetical protein AGDE_12531 [Angomonas deanei]CAD2217018.1 hypothetical protein, conserved [Angomonas deanei]|eukprot:EPY24174.1 hypothetical protein AGDE_12531 [Angomonas deanei]